MENHPYIWVISPLILNIFSPDDKKAKQEFIKFFIKNDSEDSKILIKEISTLKDGKAY